MPLSDREKQILSDIEARLRADDPKLARTVSTTTVSSQIRRRIKFSIGAFLAGFVLMLFFAVSLWFGFAGFAIMLGGAVYGGNMLKRLGQDQHHLGGQLRGGFDRYMQDRRRREDDSRS